MEIASTQKVLECCLVKDIWRKGTILQGPETTSIFVYKSLFNLVQAGVSIFSYFSVVSVVLVKVFMMFWGPHL